MNFITALINITPYLTFLLWFSNIRSYLEILRFSKRFHSILVGLLSATLVLLLLVNITQNWLFVLAAEAIFLVTSIIPLNFLVKELQLRGFLRSLIFPVLLAISSYFLLRSLDFLPIAFTLFSIPFLSLSLRTDHKLRTLAYLIPLIPLYWKSISISMLVLSGVLLYDILLTSKEMEKELEKEKSEYEVFISQEAKYRLEMVMIQFYVLIGVISVTITSFLTVKYEIYKLQEQDRMYLEEVSQSVVNSLSNLEKALKEGMFKSFIVDDQGWIEGKEQRIILEKGNTWIGISPEGEVALFVKTKYGNDKWKIQIVNPILEYPVDYVFVLKDGKVMLTNSEAFLGMDLSRIFEKPLEGTVSFLGKEYYILSDVLNFKILGRINVLILYESPSTLPIVLGNVGIWIVNVLVLLGALGVFSLLNRRWVAFLERVVDERTKELMSANEELSSMNQELIATNEELEASYETILSLNERIEKILEILNKVDISKDPRPVIREIFEETMNAMEGKIEGFKILEGDEEIIQFGERDPKITYDQDMGKGRKLIFGANRPFKLDDNERRFLTSMINFVSFLLKSRDYYLDLKQSMEASRRMMEVLNNVLKETKLENLVSLTLENLFAVFDDTCLTALAIMEDESARIWYMDNSMKLHETVLDEGIIKFSLKTEKEYLANDVEKDDIFYDVTGETRSAVSIPVVLEGKKMAISIERITRNAFKESDLDFLRIFSRLVALSIMKTDLYLELKKTYFQTVEALVYAVELKDPYTRGHSRRVADYSIRIGEELGFSKEELEDLELAALLHDIGKIGVKGAILNKPTKLSTKEFEEVKKHPVLGEQLVSKVERLRRIAKIIRHHHERYGGGGYPDGLKGEEIPLEARIIAIVDAYDAMTSDRPYRKALSKEEALRIIEENEGLQWDPNLVLIAIRILKEIGKG